MKCRHCLKECTLPLIDLGSAPPSNAYLTKSDLNRPEKWYPLKVLVCESCWLVQAEAYSGAEELFNAEYAYFSSFSSQWLEHSRRYVQEMMHRFALSETSRVVEIASNDGYLLQYFKERNIPCLGIEPTASTASAARKKGIETIEEFFGLKMAKRLYNEGMQADLMIANNVLAHVPDINDFVKGFAALLKPRGVATFEFPHLMQLIDNKQFDTIYHEHFSYLSFTAVNTIFKANGLSVFDVQELRTHGGSLRVFAQREDSREYSIKPAVTELLDRETTTGVCRPEYYQGFQEQANKIKNNFLNFLIQAWNQGKKTIAYGAAAKGNTLLNFAGVRPDLLPFVVDKNPAKQDKFMPGSRIPIVREQTIREQKPQYIVILPWNIKDEVMDQLSYVGEWRGEFVTVVPSLWISGEK